MEQRISVITLGVTDLARARRFYEALGWVSVSAPDDDVAFFEANGLVFAVWDQARLAEDSGVLHSPGWGGVALAHNVASPAEVDAVMADAETAGATVTRSPDATFWGGYSGVFTDPDGHPWEVAHNPHWNLHPDGSVTVT